MERVRLSQRGRRNIAWIEKHCFVPEGKLYAQPMRLRGWQKKDLRKIYDNPAGTRTAILSFGKKNGKSTLAACLLLLHLVGPESVPNGQLISTAQSKEQAGVLFKLAAKIVRLSPTLQPFVTVRDHMKELHCAKRGTLYRALSAEAKTAHGLSPVFAVHDELGQVEGPRSELYNAVENAAGAHEAPLSIVISTQAPTDADLLSILIDDALAGHDPRTVVSLYTADPDADPFDEQTIRQANPSAADFLNLEELQQQAARAKRLPSEEPLFRNYVLNQRVEVASPFITKDVWKSCALHVLEDLEGLPVYAGLDLSQTTDLTALVLVAHNEGRWHVQPTFWLPQEGLVERSRRDRVPYDTWAAQGHLQTTPGKALEYSYVAEHIRGLVDDLDLRKVAFDRWGFRHLRPWLLQAGMSEAEVDDLFADFGQGFRSMSPALTTLETLLLQEKVAHGGHPVLSMCAANAVIESDAAGNRKLAKHKARGRIDGLVALTMALAVAETAPPPKGPSVYESRGVLSLDMPWI
ncbi:terminase large subunit [Aquibaculum sediminis]|uniref:terminase large subunit n=1 Tax=Aquibaculum sediminis TaxID=3231907 RepID=UPI0034521F94